MKRRLITTGKTEQINIDKCNFKFYLYAVVAHVSHTKADINIHISTDGKVYVMINYKNCVIQITVCTQTGRELQQTP